MVVSRWLPRRLQNFDFMKPKVKNVRSSSILSKMVVITILVTLMNSDNRCTMRLFHGPLAVGLHCQLEERHLVAKDLGIKNRVHYHLELLLSATVNVLYHTKVQPQSLYVQLKQVIIIALQLVLQEHNGQGFINSKSKKRLSGCTISISSTSCH
jgi:hypothetical protein